jgi:DNA-binding Lrp family transcriptional regulator
MDELLQLLKTDARQSINTLAEMLGISEEEVRDSIAEYEQTGIIRGYQAVVNEDRLDLDRVRAAIEVRMKPERGGGYDRVAGRIGKFPEVDSLFLMSGGYDLLVFVKGSSLKEVAGFVNERLATLDGVLSTSTHFTLKTYKDQGVLMETESTHERLKVSP